MSQENVEIVRRGFDAFNRRDLDAFIAVCDPEVEFISYWLQVDGGGSYRGPDGVQDWWKGLLDVSPDFRAETEEVRDLGDRTISRVRLYGHGVASDAPMDRTMWHVAEFRDGQVLRWRIVASETEALEAAGLSE